jgi:hypothetical protein
VHARSHTHIVTVCAIAAGELHYRILQRQHANAAARREIYVNWCRVATDVVRAQALKSTQFVSLGLGVVLNVIIIVLLFLSILVRDCIVARTRSHLRT